MSVIPTSLDLRIPVVKFKPLIKDFDKMNPKYSNIFWHQGVKVFAESLLKTESGRVKIEHLENDVTKALLNLFEHCTPKILGAFLKLINVRL